ncbi:MAG: hypothetical protein RIQ94_169 [Pseudomonadota bacterium]|jgi:hypothetical protein
MIWLWVSMSVLIVISSIADATSPHHVDDEPK